MTDMFSKEERSGIMSRIRSKNTVAERTVFKYLRQKNIYFQRHYSRVAGTPDLALPRKKKAIFIDGDFWHGRDLERVQRLPKVYWRNKILHNIKRDEENREILKNNGWEVLQVWEKELLRKRTRQYELDKIVEFLCK